MILGGIGRWSQEAQGPLCHTTALMKALKSQLKYSHDSGDQGQELTVAKPSSFTNATLAKLPTGVTSRSP